MGVREVKMGGEEIMKICEMCFARLLRAKYYHIHYNVQQTPIRHYFCTHECKMLWVEYVREHGVPETYVEVFINK